MVDEDETMEVASVAGRKPRLMARRILSEILQPRAAEIFHLLWDEIRRAGFEKSLNSGIVLTGGGAMLEGVAEIAEQILDLPMRRATPAGGGGGAIVEGVAEVAEQIFDLPIRRGTPVGVGGLADHVNRPAFATSVGLVMYGHRNHVGETVRPVGAGAFGRV